MNKKDKKRKAQKTKGSCKKPRKIPEREGRVAVLFRVRNMLEALHLRVFNVCLWSRDRDRNRESDEP